MAAQATKLSPSQMITAAKAGLQVFNDKNWDGLRTVLTTDFTYDEVGSGRKVQGLEAVTTLFKGWAEAFPDVKGTVNNAIAGGDFVTLEVTWRGTHKGPLNMPTGPIAATGKSIETRGCIVCEMAGEKIKAERQYFDMGTLLRQIGAA